MTNVRSLGPDRPASGVALATIALQWTRIGCIGFGGPPAHIALLRRLSVEQRALDHRPRVRRRCGHDESASRSRVHPAGHLLRLATPRVPRSCDRWVVLHRARTDHYPDPVSGVPGHPPTRLDPRGRSRRRSSGAGRGGPRRLGVRPGQLEPHWPPPSAAGPMAYLRPARWHGCGHGRTLPGAHAHHLRGRRGAHSTTTATDRTGHEPDRRGRTCRPHRHHRRD